MMRRNTIPTVSIVIPSYNHARFVQAAVESVLAQKLENIELIVVDDGSSDGSVNLLSALSDSHGFKLTARENQGAHDAINRGLQECHGDYLAILNSDDYYHEDRLSLLLNNARETNAEFLYTSVEFIDDKARPISDHPRAKDFSRICDLTAGAQGIEAFLAGNPATTTSNFFFSRDLWNKVGKFRNLRYTHDWDWALRAAAFTEPKRLNLPLLSYRVHTNNTLSEKAIWRKICENAFIFASQINRAGFGNCSGMNEVLLRRFFDLLLNNENFLPYPTLLCLGLIKGQIDEDEVLDAMSEGDLISQIEHMSLSKDIPIDLFFSTKRFRNFFLDAGGGSIDAKSSVKSVKWRMARLLRLIAMRIERL